MTDIWNPHKYQEFSQERTQPALDLLHRLQIENPNIVYDLGCGTGNITQILEALWPHAKITGLDSSEAMLQVAKKEAENKKSSIQWVHADLSQWKPSEKADLIFSNSALQWVDNHGDFLTSLLQHVASHGTLAIQMPRNYQSPSHRCLVDTAGHSRWRDLILPFLRFSDPHASPVSNPDFYYNLLEPYFLKLDIWETEYLHILNRTTTGEHPVLEWMKGTALRPVLNNLEGWEKKDFLEDFAGCLKLYYPENAAGKTLFPFKRLFIIAAHKT